MHLQVICKGLNGIKWAILLLGKNGKNLSFFTCVREGLAGIFVGEQEMKELEKGYKLMVNFFEVKELGEEWNSL